MPVVPVKWQEKPITPLAAVDDTACVSLQTNPAGAAAPEAEVVPVARPGSPGVVRALLYRLVCAGAAAEQARTSKAHGRMDRVFMVVLASGADAFVDGRKAGEDGRQVLGVVQPLVDDLGQDVADVGGDGDVVARGEAPGQTAPCAHHAPPHHRLAQGEHDVAVSVIGAGG